MSKKLRFELRRQGCPYILNLGSVHRACVALEPTNTTFGMRDGVPARLASSAQDTGGFTEGLTERCSTSADLRGAKAEGKRDEQRVDASVQNGGSKDHDIVAPDSGEL